MVDPPQSINTNLLKLSGITIVQDKKYAVVGKHPLAEGEAGKVKFQDRMIAVRVIKIYADGADVEAWELKSGPASGKPQIQKFHLRLPNHDEGSMDGLKARNGI